MSTPETKVIYDGKIPDDFTFTESIEQMNKATWDLSHRASPVELTIAGVTIILDFDEGTVGVLVQEATE